METTQELELFRSISLSSLNRKEQDVLVWGGNPNGEFTVKSAYKNHAPIWSEASSNSCGRSKLSPIPWKIFLEEEC